MAYDDDLVNRVRELLATEGSITEKKMFGGLAFLLGGKMTVSASRNGGLLVRVEPSETAACLKLPHVKLMTMGGRTMDGWITVAPDGTADAARAGRLGREEPSVRQDAAGP